MWIYGFIFSLLSGTSASYRSNADCDFIKKTFSGGFERGKSRIFFDAARECKNKKAAISQYTNVISSYRGHIFGKFFYERSMAALKGTSFLHQK